MRRMAVLAAVIAAIWAGLWTPGAAAQTQFQPVAVVNDQVVTAFELEQRMRLLVLNGAARGPDLREQALEMMIEDRLRIDAARRAGVPPSAAAIEAAVGDYAAQRGLSVAALEQTLARGGVTRASLEDAVAAELAWRDVVRRRFGARAEPTAAEVEQELAMSASGLTRSFRLAEIAIPFTGRGEAAGRALADRIVAELAAGGDFAALAARHSAAPSAAQGGEIGWIPEGALPAEAAQAVVRLQPGGVTAPVPIPGGVALLKLLERRTETGGGGAATVEVMAIRAPGGGALGRLRTFLAQRPDCDAAPALAAAAGMTTERSEPTDIAALSPGVRGAVAGLEPGEASEAIQVQGGAIGFLLCSRVSGATEAARQAVERTLRQQRLTGFAAGYLQELRNDAVIELR